MFLSSLCCAEKLILIELPHNVPLVSPLPLFGALTKGALRELLGAFEMVTVCVAGALPPSM